MLNKILPGWTIQRTENDEVLVVAPKGNGAHIPNKGSLANRILHQLVGAIIDGTSKSQRPDGHRNCTFNFARHEDGEVTTMGILSFTTSLSDDDAAWDAMMDAVTKWVATTEAGRSLWNYSSHDLNIGDLAGSDAFNDPDLRQLLAERGLIVENVTVSDAEYARSYDTILVNIKDLPVEEEDAPRAC